MFEVLIAKPSKKLEEESKIAGFNSTIFVDGQNIILLKIQDKEQLRKEISRAHSKGQNILVEGSSDEINRMVAGDKRVSMLLSPEAKKQRNFMHYRDSGLNHVLCDLAIKNKVLVGIDYNSIKTTKGKERAERIGRIMQNVELCKKYKTPIVLASFGKKPYSPYTLRSFGLALGMSTSQLKESLESANGLFKHDKKD